MKVFGPIKPAVYFFIRQRSEAFDNSRIFNKNGSRTFYGLFYGPDPVSSFLADGSPRGPLERDLRRLYNKKKFEIVDANGPISPQ